MKSVYVYGGILLLSLGLAAQQWTKKPSQISGEEVFVLYGEKEGLESIVWDSEKDRTEISFRSDAYGTYMWADYTDKKNETTPQREFKIGDKGEKLVKNLSPLIAIRQLKDISPEKLEEIGLKEPKTTMTIVRKGKENIFSIGGEAYGTKDIYVQKQQTKEIFLIDDTKLRTLKTARTQLPDKNITSIKSDDITSLTINASLESESKSLVITHTSNKEAPWVRTDTPDADNKQLANWITQFLRNKNREYAQNVEESKLTQAFSVSITTDKPVEEIVVYHDENKKKWYAKSKHTRNLVVLYAAKISDLHKDLPALFDAPVAPETEKEPSTEPKK